MHGAREHETVQQPTWVRWRILSLLFAVSFVSYLLRLDISVASSRNP